VDVIKRGRVWAPGLGGDPALWPWRAAGTTTTTPHDSLPLTETW